MNIDTTSLIQDMGINAGLLSFLAALYSIVISGQRHPDPAVVHKRRRWLPWVTGLMFGVTGILTMLVPLRLAEGVIVDTRLVMTGLAGAYLSPLSALLCAAVLGAYRLSLGGIGSGPAMVGIALTTAIGWLWQRHRPFFSTLRLGSTLSDGLWLVGLGFSLAAGGMLAIQTLPPDIARAVTARSWLAVLVVYPIGTVLLGFLLDNTQKLSQREDALAQTAETLKTLLAEARQAASVFVNSKDTIAIVQPDGTVLDVNPAYSHVLGYSREELIGKSSAVLRIDEDGQAAFLRRVAHAIERGGRWHGELIRRRKNGEDFVSEVTIEGIRDPDGVVRKWVSIGKDVTEQRHLSRCCSSLATTTPSQASQAGACSPKSSMPACSMARRPTACWPCACWTSTSSRTSTTSGASPWRTGFFGCLPSACEKRRVPTTSSGALGAMNSPSC